MIVRKEYLAVPVRVEYEVTEATKNLIPILTEPSPVAHLDRFYIDLQRFYG